jgi:Domain of unknown function (DUF4124)
MVRIPKVVLAVLLAGVAAMAAAETVYKWVDGSGQVHYTDLPPRQGDAKIISVYQQESGMSEDGDAGSGDFTEEGGADNAQASAQSGKPHTAEPPISQETMDAVASDAAKAKVLQCKESQDRYQRYLDSRRLFRETADGKRVYLTDQELTEARARAKQAVNDYCS